MKDIDKLCKVLEEELRDLELWAIHVRKTAGPFERGYYEGKRGALTKMVDNLKSSFSFKNPKEDI